ncbi:hypothetical protein MHBO_000031 [Bonamia ostreae]|uniref:Uncharacterized protein n=1 Tax=Bonamia ostreae TaxID=126728 RepID=A0ABV2AE46_9EUKA
MTNKIFNFAEKLGYSVNFYTDSVVYSICKDNKQKELIVKYIKLCSANYQYIENYNEFKCKKAPKLAIMVPTNKVDSIYEKAKNTFGTEVHIILGNFFIEFLCANTNKATGLCSLLKHLKIGKL